MRSFAGLIYTVIASIQLFSSESPHCCFDGPAVFFQYKRHPDMICMDDGSASLGRAVVVYVPRDNEMLTYLYTVFYCSLNIASPASRSITKSRLCPKLPTDVPQRYQSPQ